MGTSGVMVVSRQLYHILRVAVGKFFTGFCRVRQEFRELPGSHPTATPVIEVRALAADRQDTFALHPRTGGEAALREAMV